MKKLFFMGLVMLLLGACSSRYASNGEELYLKSRNGLKLDVPAPLTGSNISYFYLLPDQSKDPRVSILPPALGTAT